MLKPLCCTCELITPPTVAIRATTLARAALQHFYSSVQRLGHLGTLYAVLALKQLLHFSRLCCSAAITFHNPYYRSGLIVSLITRRTNIQTTLLLNCVNAPLVDTGSGAAARVSLCKEIKNAYFLGPDYFKKKKVDRLSPRTPLPRHFNFSNFPLIYSPSPLRPNKVATHAV